MKCMRQIQGLLVITLMLGISMALLDAAYDIALEQAAAKAERVGLSAEEQAARAAAQKAALEAQEREAAEFAAERNAPPKIVKKPLKVESKLKPEREFGAPEPKPSRAQQLAQQAKQKITSIKQRFTSSAVERAEQQVAKTSQEIEAAQAAVQKSELDLKVAQEARGKVQAEGEEVNNVAAKEDAENNFTAAEQAHAKAKDEALQATRRSQLAVVDRDAAQDAENLAQARKRLNERNLSEQEKQDAQQAVKEAEAQAKKSRVIAQNTRAAIKGESRFSKWLASIQSKAPKGKTLSDETVQLLPAVRDAYVVEGQAAVAEANAAQEAKAASAELRTAQKEGRPTEALQAKADTANTTLVDTRSRYVRAKEAVANAADRVSTSIGRHPWKTGIAVTLGLLGGATLYGLYGHPKDTSSKSAPAAASSTDATGTNASANANQ